MAVYVLYNSLLPQSIKSSVLGRAGWPNDRLIFACMTAGLFFCRLGDASFYSLDVLSMVRYVRDAVCFGGCVLFVGFMLGIIESFRV